MCHEDKVYSPKLVLWPLQSEQTCKQSRPPLRVVLDNSLGACSWTAVEVVLIALTVEAMLMDLDGGGFSLRFDEEGSSST